MASNVIAQKMGGERKILDSVDTVADARRELGVDSSWTAKVNDEAANDNEHLDDQDFVVFASPVKGGIR